MAVEDRRCWRHIFNMREAPDDLLFLDEVARRARVSVESVRHWIKAGRLPSIRPGKRRMVLRGDLETFLGRNRTGVEAKK